MKRRELLGALSAAPVLAGASLQVHAEQLHPGVWRFRFGKPEPITPVAVRQSKPAQEGLAGLPRVAECPVRVSGSGTKRAFLVSIPLAPNEGVYGLGLQLQSHIQRGGKKRLRVNADPLMDTGDSHAPVPFYVTTRGYGVLIDTARYATFYCGGKRRKGRAPGAEPREPAAIAANALPAAYRSANFGETSEVVVEVPGVEGVDVYVFAGPSMREAVQRYNLFSGGGVLPPRWGLGLWYRVKGDFQQADVIKMGEEFRKRSIPCDVLGLEPGWHTHAYSCTYVWSNKFPEPAAMVRDLAKNNYRVNLWEHAFVHPTSPIHGALVPHSGDYEVWGGLTPDFLTADARRIYAGFHAKEHVELGVSGYKLDECDNSDFTGNWSYPEFSKFPSGADGEQMHSMIGVLYQQTIDSVFTAARKRTYGLVRSSGALAAPLPYVLYSDLYNHKEFVRGVASMGFSGLLWTPELRDAKDNEDLIRRLQAVALSPMALINAWYIKNPPWKQVQRQANNADQFAPDWERVEATCRAVMELRMRLVPYLHAAFARYLRTGLPPFRALVMDYPKDAATWPIDMQYMMGESLMVAPAFAGEKTRAVYLPEGEWFDFWTGERLPGKRRIDIEPPLERIPMYVKSGTILPLAEATPHTADPRSWKLTAQVYGARPEPAVLFEDDDEWNPALAEVTLRWDDANATGTMTRKGAGRGPRYEVVGWKRIGQ